MSTSSQYCIFSPHQTLAQCADTWLMNINTLSLEELSFISCPLFHFSLPLSSSFLMPHSLSCPSWPPTDYPSFFILKLSICLPIKLILFLILSRIILCILAVPSLLFHISLSLSLFFFLSLSFSHISSLCMSWDSIKGADSKFAAGGGASVGGMV